MERLTTRDIDGSPILFHDKGYAALLDRLAAYEDTGLEPEEIKACMDGLDEYRKAEADGRLLVLPCKVGDTVYTAQRCVVSELIVNRFEFYDVGIWVGWDLVSGLYGNFRMDGFPANDFGKKVFRTREEAEAKLKGMESDG